MPLGNWLVVLGVLLNAAAIFAYQWVTPLPALGVRVLYHLRSIRIAIALIATTSSGIGTLLAPGPFTWVGLALTLLLMPFSGALQAKHALVPLDDPVHRAGKAGSLSPEAEVLGAEIESRSIAWPLTLLVPHHIVNDQVGERAIAATW